jgi:hypothetical protein
MPESLVINILIIGTGFLFCCFALIFIIRYILEYIIYKSAQNYKKLKKHSQKILTSKSPKKFDKVDEELFRKKTEIPKSHSQTKAENASKKLEQQYQIIEENLEQEDEEKIIGVAKPIGFWTRKIFGERIATVMAQAESLKKGQSTKFWQNFVIASQNQARYQENNRKMR